MTNKIKIELIRKLLDARLTPGEREILFKKAKEIIERDKISKTK